jgi:hypothetical protein
LASRLAKLTDAGLLTRHAVAGHRQKVDYFLTEAAIELVPLIIELGAPSTSTTSHHPTTASSPNSTPPTNDSQPTAADQLCSPTNQPRHQQSMTMRRQHNGMIAAFVMLTIDGFYEGPNGAVDSWKLDDFERFSNQ